MKKLILSIFAAASVMTAAAGTTPGIEYSWAKLIDGSTNAGDQSTSVTVGAKGGIYWFGTYGSTEADPAINFDGTFLFDGAPYNAGTSQNNNFTLIKTDADGNLLWNVHSTYGDFENNAGGSAATSDGGVVVISKVRHTGGLTDRNVTFVDASGTATEIDWACADPARRNYIMLVTKISAEGKIEWNRQIKFSTEPGPKASGNYAGYWSNVFNTTGVTVDGNDNVYVAVNLRNPMYVGKADGTTHTITPLNNQNWTGDPQSAVGDFLILGLDKDGYYRNSLTLEGEASTAYCQKVEYAAGKVYAQGYITGNGTDLKAGSFTLAPSKIMSPVLLCIDTDFDVKWAKCYQGEQVQNKNGFQNVGISVVGDNLWMCGQFNLKFTDPDNADNVLTSTQGNIREGFILKVNAADGKWLAARTSRDDDWNEPSALAKTGLTGYFRVLQNAEKPEKIYVFGYVMNANVGVFLRQYDANTLEGNLEEGQNNIVTKGGVPSCQTIAYDAANGAAYFTARGNQAFAMLDGTTTAAPVKWGILAAKYLLPADMKTSGIVDITVDDDENAPVEYYNLQGIRVANPSHGIYIRRQGRTATKVAF